MFSFIVLLVVIGASFYFYQKLTALEQEIRAEQARARAAAAPPLESPKSSVDSSPHTIFDEVETPSGAVAEAPSESAAVTAEGGGLEKAIIAEVAKNPAMKQTELYQVFPETDRKQLQTLVKELADGGKIKRQKQGNSYLLYSV